MILTDRKRGETSPVITHFSPTENGVLNLFSITGPADGTGLFFDRDTRQWVTTEISGVGVNAMVKV